MNHDEIEASVIRAKAGNQEDLLKLFEQYKPFIFKIANKFSIKNHDTYDLLQIGYITLVNAIAKYRTGTHTFSSYAFNSIKNTFKYTARQNSKYASDLSLNAPLNIRENTVTEFMDCIEAEDNLEEDLINSINLREVRSAIAKLPEDELELVLLIYYSEISINTYAIKKGIHYLTAVRRKNRILKKLSGWIKK
jgi:RNA polymerase sigma factor (sigma-70 family)